jgi:hypothetical protein
VSEGGDSGSRLLWVFGTLAGLLTAAQGVILLGAAGRRGESALAGETPQMVAAPLVLIVVLALVCCWAASLMLTRPRRGGRVMLVGAAGVCMCLIVAWIAAGSDSVMSLPLWLLSSVLPLSVVAAVALRRGSGTQSVPAASQKER